MEVAFTLSGTVRFKLGTAVTVQYEVPKGKNHIKKKFVRNTNIFKKIK